VGLSASFFLRVSANRRSACKQTDLGSRGPISQELSDTEPGTRANVVIVDGEGGRSRAIRRFNRLAVARGPANPALQSEPNGPIAEIYWHSPHDLSLSADDATEQLARLLKPLNPVLLIIDTLAKVMGLADENSNAAASRVTKALYTLNQHLGAALLLLVTRQKPSRATPLFAEPASSRPTSMSSGT